MARYLMAAAHQAGIVHRDINRHRGHDCHARLELDNWTGHKFTDMFTLLKTDGEWKIISKVFYLHSKS